MAEAGRSAKVSDAEFTGGWAVFAFQGDKAHYWKDIDGPHLDKIRSEMVKANPGKLTDGIHFYQALCGHIGYARDCAKAMTEMTPNWPKCKHCQRLEGDENG